MIFVRFIVLLAIVCGCSTFAEESEEPTLPLVSLQVFRNGSVRMAEEVEESTSLPVNNSQKLENQIRTRERIKQERLLNIQAQILQRLGLVGRIPASIVNVTASSLNDEAGKKLIDVVKNGPPPTAKTFLDDMNSDDLNSGTGVTNTGDNEMPTSEIYAQRLQSFYPSCRIPNYTDVELWNSAKDQQMKLYFDLTIPKSTNLRTHITIMWAKLRLFMFARANCVRKQFGTETDTSTYVDMMIHCESSTITISLYQYMRPLKQNRKERRRMLDSRTVPVSYQGNIEFNMQSVINYWQNMQHRNYGLMVLVEDAFGNPLPPTMYIKQMNCSDSELPIPNLADLYGKEVLNETVNFGKTKYPTLDLMTMETAREDSGSSSSSSKSLPEFTKPSANTVYQKIMANDFEN